MAAWPYLVICKEPAKHPAYLPPSKCVLSTLSCPWDFLFRMAQYQFDTLITPADKLLLSSLNKLGGHSPYLIVTWNSQKNELNLLFCYFYAMSREEMKSAINELLDKTDEQVLNEVLTYLKSVKDKSAKTIQLTQNLRTLLDEDKELLQRLAK